MHRFLAALLLTSALVAAQQLPERSAASTAATDAELFTAPPIVLEAAELPTAPPSPKEVERARRTRDWAKSKADRWSRLQRSGVFSKVEVEQATRQASQANVRYQQLHVAQLRAQVKELRARPADPAMIETAEAALRTSETLCAAAEESWKKLEVALAETNLARRRALARSGLGSKSDLRRAESEVARLRQGL
jgi:multidrug resistance efflux pump